MLPCWFYLTPSLHEKRPELRILGSFEALMSYSLLSAAMVVLPLFPYCCEIGLSQFRVFTIKDMGVNWEKNMGTEFSRYTSGLHTV